MYYVSLDLDVKIEQEIDQFNLPVDSIKVDYENKSLLLQSLDLIDLLRDTSTLADSMNSNSKLKLGEIKLTGVDWWKLYNNEVLEADTVYILNARIDLSETDIKFLQFNSNLPFHKIKANVLIVEGDSSSYKFENENILLASSFEFIKSKVDLNLKDIGINELLNNVKGNFKELELWDINKEKKISCDQVKYLQNLIELRGLSFDKDGLKLKKSTAQIIGLNLREALVGKPIRIDTFHVLKSEGLHIIKSFDLNKYTKKEYLKGLEIDKFIFNARALTFENQYNGNTYSGKTSAIYTSKSNIKIDKLSDVLEIKDLVANQIDIKINGSQVNLRAEKCVLRNRRYAFQNGQIHYKNKNSLLDMEFLSFDVWQNGLISSLRDNKIVIDSSHLEIQNASINEYFLDRFSSSNELPFELIAIGSMHFTGNQLDIDFRENIDLRASSFTGETGAIKMQRSNANKLNSYHINLNNVKGVSLDGTKKISTKDLVLNQKEVVISGMKIDPTERAKLMGNTSYSMNIPSIKIGTKELQSYLDSHLVSFENLEIDGLEIIITTDETISNKDEYKELISETLMNLKTPLNISKFSLLNSMMLFKYRPEKDTEFSQLFFENINLNISNICNNRQILKNNPYMKMVGNATFMGKAPLEIDAKFSLIGEEYPYEYKIELGTLDFVEVNDMLTDLAGLKIKKGRLDKLLCNVKADKYQSKGVLDFYYRNLKVRFDKDKFIEQWNPVNFMITRFVLDQDNRQEWEHETGVIDIRRDPSRTMYYQIWSAVFSGMKYVMLPVL